MGFLPYSVIKLRTDLTLAEVYQKLRELVETSSANSNDGKNGPSKKPYKGKVEYDSFEIVRRIGYKNSFVPKIKGVVCNNGMYTAIRLRLRPSAFVMGFMLLWLIPVFLTCLWAIYISFKEGFEPGMAMPFGMFLFGLFLPRFGFGLEKKITLKDFREHLHTEEDTGVYAPIG